MALGLASRVTNSNKAAATTSADWRWIRESNEPTTRWRQYLIHGGALPDVPPKKRRSFMRGPRRVFSVSGFMGLRWTGEAGSGVNVRFIQCLVKQELFDDGVELVSVLLQHPPRLSVALVSDPADLVIHRAKHAVGYPGHARITISWENGEFSDAVGHAPPADHGPSDARHHLEITFGPGRDDVEHFVFGGHAAQRANDATAQVVGIVSIAVRFRRGQRHT